jgi:protein-S-isoprenylcysteine O-methyltransferase Ste14
MRRMRREMDKRLLWFVIVVLVVVGSILIAFSYGTSAALAGLGCLLAGAGLIGLLWLIFTLLGKWAGAER